MLPAKETLLITFPELWRWRAAGAGGPARAVGAGCRRAYNFFNE